METLGKLRYDGEIDQTEVSLKEGKWHRKKKKQLLLRWAERLIQQANELEDNTVDKEVFHQLHHHYL